MTALNQILLPAGIKIVPMLNNSLQAIAVYTGATNGTNPRNVDLAKELGRGLAQAGVRLIYGGGQVGLMGAVSDAVIDAEGSVTGVIPAHLVMGEVAHPRVQDMETVGTMLERKRRMAELADAFVCLPGGTGTLDEFFDVWTGQQLGLHAKPIALLGRDYWAPLVAMLDHMVTEGLVRAVDRDALIMVDSTEELFAAFSTWEAPVPKWRSQKS